MGDVDAVLMELEDTKRRHQMTEFLREELKSEFKEYVKCRGGVHAIRVERRGVWHGMVLRVPYSARLAAEPSGSPNDWVGAWDIPCSARSNLALIPACVRAVERDIPRVRAAIHRAFRRQETLSRLQKA